MRRRLTEKERAALNVEWPDLMARRSTLKAELRDQGKSIRDEIKLIEQRAEAIAAILRHGEIEEDDQLQLEETNQE